jgi:hypothetical protein
MPWKIRHIHWTQNLEILITDLFWTLLSLCNFPWLWEGNHEGNHKPLVSWNLALPTQRGISHRLSMKLEARYLVNEKIYEVVGQRKRKSIGHGVQIIVNDKYQ